MLRVHQVQGCRELKQPRASLGNFVVKRQVRKTLFVDDLSEQVTVLVIRKYKNYMGKLNVMLLIDQNALHCLGCGNKRHQMFSLIGSHGVDLLLGHPKGFLIQIEPLFDCIDGPICH